MVHIFYHISDAHFEADSFPGIVWEGSIQSVQTFVCGL